MAEVEKVSSTAAASTANVTAADIPASGGASSVAEFGTSPTQERSSNSHPHDSEYDTASDLEGGEEYDDDEDDDLDDDSLTDGESITDDDDDVEDDERPMMGAEKADAEAQKKVDEDRSNPQYIPKRGTFYEHDDRTAEGDPDVALVVGETGDPHEGANGVKSPQSPTISHASKTMKKWQPASGVERWSHDRFDESEQAPKSRSELVSAYGYDIRTEDAPPRARRRRRYGRGPSKYLRNWEDENAYLKASNKDRKPPRPSDFPALNERNTKTRRVRSTREEKENRMERRAASEKLASEGSVRSGNQEERRDSKASGSSNQKSKTNYGRPNAQVGRQAAMEFKQKQRNGQSQQPSTSQNNVQNSRNDAQYERQPNRQQHSHNSIPNDQQPQRSGGGVGNKSQTHSRQQQQSQAQPQQHDAYNNNQSNNKQHEHSPYQQLQQSQQQQPMSMRQPVQSKNAASGSNLSQRLQQVQNRNDPSHVGSVQMHALATQNQMVNQQQQQQTNMILSPAQPQQQLPTTPMEQRGPPKRYSSLRRSQHEAQHLAEQLQQMQLQQQHQPQAPIMLPEPHMIQANLMQLYHQEMQVLQTNQPPGQPKQPSYAPVPAGTQPQPQPYAGATGAAAAPAAYYVAAAPDAYTATAAGNAQAQPPAQYAQQPPPNYMPATQPAPSAAPLAYAPAPPPAQQAVPGAAPPTYGPATAVPPTATAAAAAAAGAPPPNSNFSNYQNYNTVGGTTYFVPPAQTTTRPVVLPQRRPTNAIPILPPSEKNKQRAAESKDETKTGGANTTSQPAAPIGSAENIDHIIDNMFVQRPALQPQRQAFQPQQATSSQARKSSSPSSGAENNASASTAELSSNSTAPATQADDAASNNVPTTSSADKVSSGSVDGATVESSNNNTPVAAQE